MPYPDNISMQAFDRAQGRDDDVHEAGRDELIARAENKNKAAAAIISAAIAALRKLDLEEVPCMTDGYDWSDLLAWPVPVINPATSRMVEDWADEKVEAV